MSCDREELQEDLDLWLEYYNNDPTDVGLWDNTLRQNTVS